MTVRINLQHNYFTEKEIILLKNSEFTVSTFKYLSKVEGLKIANSRGYLIVLPFEGLMIWDAIFDDLDLKMKNTFKQPRNGDSIVDSYGAFQFHSGLLANGNPGVKDTHQPHGEFPLSIMDSSFLEINENEITIRSQKEYIKGFGAHYFAEPAVTMTKSSALFDIKMTVKNMSNFDSMPLQYMVHLNYNFIEGSKINQNIPDNAFNLRESVPDHIHPTKEWISYTSELENKKILVNSLDNIQYFYPEIVYFADRLDKLTKVAKFSMVMDNHVAKVAFNTTEFPYLTRWLMYNPDMQVAAFALPATSRSEGYTQAKNAGSLIFLNPQESRHFKVTTGLEGQNKKEAK
ncbi:DUF4432 family protein [Leuconostoc gelidum]|uniref:DUF4432 family protein n=1 Tax=Leuconostoc gelidum TaxID=1244 RepID=UPI001C7E0DBA|nr:DUF4432 family protein [Leuconostoc gelidum]MBZ6010995.1 DUF4432 family protein [Leuconostoc gelidum subsp. aenigmaticum]